MSTSDPSQQTLDLSAGSYVKGLPLSSTSFLAVTTFAQLSQIMRDPRDLQPNARRGRSFDADQLEDEASIHELVQRALIGAKKANVPKYGAYILDTVMERTIGVLPPIHTWSQAQLQVVTYQGTQYLLVPQGMRLFSIDGETQLTAHYEVQTRSNALPEEKKVHREFPLAIVVHHGVTTETARQYFHDLNILAVKPNTSLGLAMDTKDPLMRVVQNLEVRIPDLNGRVEKSARQLPKRSSKLMTIQSLRQFVVNVLHGMAGVQFGAKPAPLPGNGDLGELEEVTRKWLEMYLRTFLPEISDRERTLAGTAPVLAAVGAMGNQFLKAADWDRERLMRERLDSLTEVDWTKGEAWAGVAGKFTARGRFSVGGTKEVGNAVYNVLTEAENPGFRRVRGEKSVSALT
ncbi:DNA sulfur modification protein DndB [Conexibacter stalactiti]|uniref:DNA sulfur modification protein DndB n=1 Tax=Conexibacter stalactiti TaxID=1940611 RepID=A0ABU4HY70_9ACTN|nr:DNA sulfur modification protein DndB [Conexibacter stalactiti]MDW5598270.1 DNA sulfur modification protein DndB [Conexibacter stalactiti]MEC5038912.1 DNA sulfur modification protein DndB [Conexibacter stalactiti]